MPLLYSQVSLTFCTYVDQYGYCAFNNNKFITSPDSTTGRIFMRVKSETALGPKLTYKVYSIDKDKKEKLFREYDQTLQPEWLMAWEPYNFPTGAKYNVKIYNAANIVICSQSFELIKGGF